MKVSYRARPACGISEHLLAMAISTQNAAADLNLTASSSVTQASCDDSCGATDTGEQSGLELTSIFIQAKSMILNH